MNFNVNAPILYLFAGVIILAVLAQSIFFLVKAWKHGLEIGMEKEKLKRIAKTSAVFTVAPAAAIVISVITLSKDLGIPLPWLRLSVVGSLSYETIAAGNALNAMGMTFGKVDFLTAREYITVAFVMTFSIMVGIWLVPLIGEKLQNGVISLENRDKKWSEIFQSAMFIGMISAFLGYVFSDFSGVFFGKLSGLIPVLVLFVSAFVMTFSGMVFKLTKWRWISDYALPISLIAGMASAIPFTSWLS